MDNESQFSNLQKLSDSYHSPIRQYNQYDDQYASEKHQQISQSSNSISPKKLSTLSYPIQTFDTMKRFNTYKAQVEKKKNESLNSSRFHDLYEDGQKIQKKKDELIRKKLEEEQNYKDPECTFKPKIKKYNTQSADQDKKTIFDKNQEWKQKVEGKMQSKYQNIADKDLKECTFHPNIDQDWKNKFEEPLSDFNSKGIPQFLKRQVIARKMKEYKEFIMNYPHRKHEMKNNTFTVPNEPVLGICENHIKSLDRPLIPEHLFDSFEQQLHPRQFRSSLSDSKHNKQDQPLNQTYRKMIDNQISIDPKSNFQDALKQLHEALHNIEI